MPGRTKSQTWPLCDPRCIRGMVFATVLLAVGALAQPLSLVANGGFERGGSGWSVPPGIARIEDSPRGGKCLEMTGGGAVQDVYVVRVAEAC